MVLRMVGFWMLVSPAALFAQETLKLKVEAAGQKPSDVAGYDIGYNIGTQLRTGGIPFDDIKTNDFLSGLVDALKGTERRVTRDEVEAAMKILSGKVEARMQEVGKANLARSNAFLEENKKKQGVTALPSGLQYEVLKSGNGAMPTLASTVTVHYEGKLVSGKVFDSSLKNGQPATFPVGQVIPGWTEALSRMKVGDKWRLFIPPALGYGAQGAGADIGPNEALIFEVELLQIR